MAEGTTCDETTSKTNVLVPFWTLIFSPTLGDFFGEMVKNLFFLNLDFDNSNKAS